MRCRSPSKCLTRKSRSKLKNIKITITLPRPAWARNTAKLSPSGHAGSPVGVACPRAGFDRLPQFLWSDELRQRRQDVRGLARREPTHIEPEVRQDRRLV